MFRALTAACLGILPMLVVSGAIWGSGCSLALDFDKPVLPDAPIDAIVPECIANEPNDSPMTSTSLVGTDASSALCGDGDLDYFAFVTPVGSSMVDITLTFAAGGGNLDMRLLNGASLMEIGRTSGDTVTKKISCPGLCTAAPNTLYYIEISGTARPPVSRYLLNVVR
jgi:hypothetical protein